MAATPHTENPELTHALLAARAATAQSEALLAAVGDGISIQDRNFTILYQNRAHVAMTGSHRGRQCYLAYENNDTICPGCPMARCFADGGTHTCERKVPAGGLPRYFEITASPLRDAEGNITAGIEIVREITARKEAEEEKRNLVLQLEHVQKLESLGVLAGGIAHDFNNLLMAIMGNAELVLLELPDSSPARDNLRTIMKASRRAADLCKQLLTYAGKGQFLPARVDVNELIRDMEHLLRISVSKRTQLVYHLAEKTPAVQADANQLRQIMINLVINASEAIGDRNGNITITTGAAQCDQDFFDKESVPAPLRRGPCTFFAVADTGCGMDEKTKAKLFDPFFTTKFPGRGLGMSAVMGIVRGHCGCITISSEPGQGTIIKIFLPAMHAESGQPMATPQHKPPPATLLP